MRVSDLEVADSCELQPGSSGRGVSAESSLQPALLSKSKLRNDPRILRFQKRKFLLQKVRFLSASRTFNLLARIKAD